MRPTCTAQPPPKLVEDGRTAWDVVEGGKGGSEGEGGLAGAPHPQGGP